MAQAMRLTEEEVQMLGDEDRILIMRMRNDNSFAEVWSSPPKAIDVAHLFGRQEAVIGTVFACSTHMGRITFATAAPFLAQTKRSQTDISKSEQAPKIILASKERQRACNQLCITPAKGSQFRRWDTICG